MSWFVVSVAWVTSSHAVIWAACLIVSSEAPAGTCFMHRGQGEKTRDVALVAMKILCLRGRSPDGSELVDADFVHMYR